MEDETSMLFTGSECFLESLARTRQILLENPILLAKIDEVLLEELELALMGSKKAKSELLKGDKDNIRPIGGKK